METAQAQVVDTQVPVVDTQVPVGDAQDPVVDTQAQVVDDTQVPVGDTQAPCETYSYSADTAKVMNILVRSIYTDKDIFLRELISNASDAISKVYLQDLKYQVGNEIKIWADKEKSQLIIQDTGCGITKEELITKVGSIGTSGTKQFMEAIAKSKDQMIGQFGVGFYSVYLVASSVKLITKPVAENKIWEWTSQSESSYSIRELGSYDDDNFTRGTKIILTLSPEHSEYLEQDTLSKIIKTHSSYITHPILFEKSEHKKGEDGNYYEELIWERMNWVPLWVRPKEDIQHQEYVDFYLNNIQDNLDQHVKEEPIIYKHFKVEGAVNFTALLYIPEKAPFNLFEPSKRGQSLKLYTKNVLITADHKDLYPRWMEFVKGIVDTSDIELNVSRQTIQNTSKLRKISNRLAKAVIEMMEELAEDKDKYALFYKEFSSSIKNGIHEEFSPKEYRNNADTSDRMCGNKYAKQMMKLLRFNTSLGRNVGFDEYVRNMKSDQKAIYYIAGDKKEALELSPFMDRLKLLNLEVLYFEEPIDEYIKEYMTEYKMDEWGGGDVVGLHDPGYERFKKPDMNDMGIKTFVDVCRDELLLPESENQTNMDKSQGDELCEKLDQLYKDIGVGFFKVKLDNNFTSAPAIVVNQLHISAQLEKLMANNATTKRDEQYRPALDRKNLLISSSNPLIKHLHKIICQDKTPLDNPELIELAKYIRTMALIAGGYEADNSFKFVKKFGDLLLESLIK